MKLKPALSLQNDIRFSIVRVKRALESSEDYLHRETHRINLSKNI